MPGDRGKPNEPNDITTFVRLLYIHMPMYYHVCKASPNLADPYGALDVAENYLSKKGHNNVYFTQIMKDNLLQWGFTINEANATSNTSPAQPITPNTTILPPMHSGIESGQNLSTY